VALWVVLGRLLSTKGQALIGRQVHACFTPIYTPASPASLLTNAHTSLPPSPLARTQVLVDKYNLMVIDSKHPEADVAAMLAHH